jgi:tRNA(adenine34) deaminase
VAAVAAANGRKQMASSAQIVFMVTFSSPNRSALAVSRRQLPLGRLLMDNLIDQPTDESFMTEALRFARKALEKEEVPVGAVVVRAGKIIARAFNQVEMLKDATAHAEMLAITQAEAAVGDWRLNDCDLYVTKEPCAMCAGALIHVRVRRVIFGCADPRSGAAGGALNLLQMPSLNHRCEITSGILGEECADILQSFFRARRSTDIPNA